MAKNGSNSGWRISLSERAGSRVMRSYASAQKQPGLTRTFISLPLHRFAREEPGNADVVS